MNGMSMKLCRMCGVEKERETEFYVSRSRNGYQSHCKKCQLEGPRPDRAIYFKGPGRASWVKAGIKASKKFPEKWAARQAVTRAVNRGELIRPTVCEMQNEVCKFGIQGHHPDYTKPLEVRWLCGKHHRLLHEQLKKDNPT
jgi:hypothetical protein